MTTTCEICGRELVEGDLERKCYYADYGSEAGCYRIGYEREKKRADDLEAAAQGYKRAAEYAEQERLAVDGAFKVLTRAHDTDRATLTKLEAGIRAVLEDFDSNFWSPHYMAMSADTDKAYARVDTLKKLLEETK